MSNVDITRISIIEEHELGAEEYFQYSFYHNVVPQVGTTIECWTRRDENGNYMSMVEGPRFVVSAKVKRIRYIHEDRKNESKMFVEVFVEVMAVNEAFR